MNHARARLPIKICQTLETGAPSGCTNTLVVFLFSLNLFQDRVCFPNVINKTVGAVDADTIHIFVRGVDGTPQRHPKPYPETGNAKWISQTNV